MRGLLGEEAVEAGALAATVGELFGARGTVVRACPESPETVEEERASFEALLVDEMRQEQVGLFGRASDLRDALGNPIKIRLAQDGAATAILEAAREGGESAALIA